jgi:ribosomal-protein-alanine N-acetyltransferase
MRLTHTGTREIETGRLRLRRFVMEDANEIFREWASDANVTRYLSWERHRSAAQTKTFLLNVIGGYEQEDKYSWGIELKESGSLIGSIAVSVKNEYAGNANVGYCLGERFWNLGYATEALRAVLDYMFYDVNINRIEAMHSTNNPASGKVMQKAGMLKEGRLRQNFITSGGEYQDSDLYALVKEDFEHRYKPEYQDFFDLENKDLSKHNIKLVCHEYYPGDEIKKYVPSYRFKITEKSSDTSLGYADLRLGFSEGLYYGGHIGYTVSPEYQNMGVATVAAKIILQIAKAHGIKKIIITNNPENKASARVCEKVGAKLIRVAKVPSWTEMYKEGERYKNIYEVVL